MQASAIMPTYGRLPVSFRRGLGAWLEDENGERYLDALGGIAVCALGHAHPAVTAAIGVQAHALLHTSNLYHIPLQEQLAARLRELTGLDYAFFCNSGAEANEAAIKIARRHGHARGIDRPVILVMENAFHGRTLATLTATGNRRAQAGFEPLVEGFLRVPYDDLAAIDAVADHPDIVAVLVEPIQGEGGIHIPTDDYLPGLRERCDRHGWLLMLDEVQAGVGRTGRWFGHQHAGIRPDVLSSAKALANGVPIGVCLATRDAAAAMQAGSHGSTFGGNPLAAATALAVLRTITDDGLVERAAVLGERIVQGLRQRLADGPGVADIRGRGLMIGVELDHPCPELPAQALDRRLLINVTAGSVVRLLPPYILSDSEADELVQRVADLILAHLQERQTAAAADTGLKEHA